MSKLDDALEQTIMLHRIASPEDLLLMHRMTLLLILDTLETPELEELVRSIGKEHGSTTVRIAMLAMQDARTYAMLYLKPEGAQPA